MDSRDRGITVTRRGGGGGGSGLKLLRIPERNEDQGVELGELDEEPLSPTARLFHEPRYNCHVLAIIGSAKKFDFDAVKAELEKTLIRHPRFSSVPEFSEGKLGRWVPTKVVVADHCVFPDVDPDDHILRDPDRFVEDYVAALTRTPMDMSRPLWEFHGLNVKTREAEGVALLRAHHSLGDGTSLISLLLALTSKTSGDPDSLPADPPPPLLRVSRRRRPIIDNISNRSVAGFAAAAWMLLRMAFNTLVDLLLFVATFLFLKDSETALKGAEGVEFRPKRIVHRTVQLDDFKLIKTDLNTTINDVMMGVTSAGLSRYLSRATYSGGDLPRNLLVRSAILVNLRPTPGFHVMAKMMEKRGGTGTSSSSHRDRWGNWIGYVLVPFPMALFQDPLDYVRKAKAIADRKKLSFESLFTFASSALLVNTFGIKVAAALSHRVIFNTTLSFSNLAGPAEELSFAGHPITFLAPSAYGHPHALTVHFQSYMDKVKMVLAVDEEAIPEPHQLLQDLADSLELIKDAVLAKR